MKPATYKGTLTVLHPKVLQRACLCTLQVRSGSEIPLALIVFSERKREKERIIDSGPCLQRLHKLGSVWPFLGATKMMVGKLERNEEKL